VGLWILIFRATDLYRLRKGDSKEALALLRACSVAALLTLLLGFLAHLQISRITVIAAYFLSISFVLLLRAITRALLKRLYTQPNVAIPLVIVGLNPVGAYLCDQILSEITHYELIGFVDDGNECKQYHGFPVLGQPERLAELSSAYPNLEAAIAQSEAPRDRQEQIVRLCERHRVRWWIVPWLFHSAASRLKFETIGSVPLIGPCGPNLDGLNYCVKRGFDLVLSSLLLILSAPFTLLAALAILLVEGRPILFRQVRIGIRGNRFDMLKFRTMRCGADDRVHREYVRRWIHQARAASERAPSGKELFKLAADDRITTVGRALRRLSLDELPQLINVIRGEMSLIGPRPALPYEIDLYEDWHRRRLHAPPGITGLWQVSGRNHLSFDEMVRLDIQYLEDWSFIGDLRILARTMPVVLRGSGV